MDDQPATAARFDSDRLFRFRAQHPCSEATIGRVRWEYITCGRGSETLLLLTGGLRVAETAFGYVELLEHALRLVVPGYPALASVDQLVDGIAAILDLQAVDRVHVLGQSYGGMVAQVLVCRHPERVIKLVLSGAGPLSASRVQKGILELILALILALAPRLPERLLKAWWRSSLQQVLSVQPADRAFWNAYLRETADQRWTRADVLSHFQTGKDALRYAAGREGARPWEGQVLILGGERDPVSTRRDRERLAAHYPHARICTIPLTGHTAAMQEPAAYAAAVLGFLQEESDVTAG